MRRMAGLWAALLLVLALTPVQAGAVELPIQAEGGAADGERDGTGAVRPK